MGALRRRRASESSEVDTEGSWAISYGDMITLLLTFFILFFSTDKNRDRMQAMDAALMLKLQSRQPSAETPTKGVESKSATGVSVPDQAGVDIRDSKLDAKVYKVGDKLIVEFPNTSFYGFGKVDLTKEGKRELADFVRVYMPYAGNYLLGVRAFTDHKKVKNQKNRRFADNLELSALRAVAAMRTLQTFGIPLNRMRLGGYGELRLSDDDLSRAIASSPTSDRTGISTARKVILIIEPDVKEKL